MKREEEKVRVFSISPRRMGSDGEGVTTLVALSGCPLSCAYCINPQCKRPSVRDLNVTATDVVRLCMPDNLYFLATGGGITIGGGEPLMHPQFVHEMRADMPEGWTMNMETSLGVPLSHLTQVIDDVSLFVIDVKDMNADIYHAYTNHNQQQLIANLELLAERGMQGKCIIRLPLIHGYSTIDDIQASQRRLSDMGFSQFNSFKYINPATHKPFCKHQ